MPDRESVITHLQIISTWASFARERDLQFFTAKHLEDISQWANDAITLLKEQEAELSYRNTKAITHTATKLEDATCPSCGNVVRVRYDYCHYCGQKLDWEGL